MVAAAALLVAVKHYEEVAAAASRGASAIAFVSEVYGTQVAAACPVAAVASLVKQRGEWQPHPAAATWVSSHYPAWEQSCLIFSAHAVL